MVNRQRILEDFFELVSFDSVSFSERTTADWVIARLTKLGFNVEEDQAGRALKGSSGNVYGYLKGSIPGPPILLSAHMDVVQPGIHKSAFLHEDGTITSSGTTVLGGDDICGIVEIIEGITILKEQEIPHRDVEVIFSIAEEVYCKGINAFDFSKIRAKEAYIFDLSGPIGSAAIQAPTILSFEVAIQGIASHAGFEPEKGVHSIALMSDFIHEIKQGYVDNETTLNIGTILGGVATNIVPESCRCSGEIRSYHHKKALECMDMLRNVVAKTVEETKGSFTIETRIHVEAYKLEESSQVVKRFKEACQKLKLSGDITKTFGGSDNNHFASHGIPGIVLSCGMYQVHSVKEYTTVEDLEKGALLVTELLKK